METSPTVRCPYCGSASVEFTDFKHVNPKNIGGEAWRHIWCDCTSCAKEFMINAAYTFVWYEPCDMNGKPITTEGVCAI